MKAILSVFVLFAAAVCVPVSPAEESTKVNPKDGLVYVRIVPGKFSMGCSAGDNACFSWEKTIREVVVHNGFWIGQTEVTQRAYLQVMGTNPSRYRGDRLPVDQVSWYKARQYCQAVGMRLPTEIEWEYAARGGTVTVRYGSLDDVAWHDGNSEDRTHQVGAKKPNSYGLYDTLGNVWEWTEDAHPGDPRKKVLRGDSFFNRAEHVRVSDRLWALPDTAHRVMGVRCAGD